MAHFAEINKDNIVERVLVIPDNQEHRGNDFLSIDLKLGGRWIQTSYNNKIRKQFAAKGYYYDEINDVFISPKPYESWILNDNFDWVAPVELPDNDLDYYWDEDKKEWIEL